MTATALERAVAGGTSAGSRTRGDELRRLASHPRVRGVVSLRGVEPRTTAFVARCPVPQVKERDAVCPTRGQTAQEWRSQRDSSRRTACGARRPSARSERSGARTPASSDRESESLAASRWEHCSDRCARCCCVRREPAGNRTRIHGFADHVPRQRSGSFASEDAGYPRGIEPSTARVTTWHAQTSTPRTPCCEVPRSRSKGPRSGEGESNSCHELGTLAHYHCATTAEIERTRGGRGMGFRFRFW